MKFNSHRKKDVSLLLDKHLDTRSKAGEGNYKRVCLFLWIITMTFIFLSQVSAITVEFDSSTPSDGTVQPKGEPIEILINITDSNVEEIIYNWQSLFEGTNINYTAYSNSLVLMMNFDNVSALGENDTHIFDISGKGNNGTGIDFEGDEIVAGKYGKALNFDGTNDLLNITLNSLPTGSSDRTISFWAYSDGTQNKSIIGYGNKATNQSFDITYVDGIIGINSTGNDVSTDFGNTICSDGQWEYVVFTYDGSTIKSYIDGVNKNSVEQVLNTIDSGQLQIGGGILDSNDFFDGKIDNLMIWNRTLSWDEINQSYMMNLHKYNVNKWALYVNQEKSPKVDLYSLWFRYQSYGFNTTLWNETERRNIIISSVVGGGDPTTYIDDCINITTKDTYQLNDSIVDDRILGDCIKFNESSGGSTLNCNGYSIDASDFGQGAIFIDGVNNITLKDCVLVGVWDYGIYSLNVNNLTVRNLTVSYTNSRGNFAINTNNSNFSYIVDNSILGINFGDYNNSVDNYNGTAVNIDGNLTNFYTRDTTGATRMINGTIYDITGTGTGVSGVSYMENVFISGFQDGLSASELIGINITIQNATDDCLDMLSNSNVFITGLNIKDCGDHAIDYSGSTSGTDNIIDCAGGMIEHNFTGGAIRIGNSGNGNNTFQNCNFVSNHTTPLVDVLTYYGIVAIDGVDEIYSINNTFENMDAGVRQLSDVGSFIQDTTCNNTGHCVCLDGASNHEVINTTNNLGVAIATEYIVGIPTLDSINNTITNSTCKGRATCIYANSGSAGATDNLFSGMDCSESVCVDSRTGTDTFDFLNRTDEFNYQGGDKYFQIWTGTSTFKDGVIKNIGSYVGSQFFYDDNDAEHIIRNFVMDNIGSAMYFAGTGASVYDIVIENYTTLAIQFAAGGKGLTFDNMSFTGTGDGIIANGRNAQDNVFTNLFINNTGRSCYWGDGVIAQGSSGYNWTNFTCITNGVGFNLNEERIDNHDFINGIIVGQVGSSIGIDIEESDNHILFNVTITGFATGMEVTTGTGSITNNSIICSNTNDILDPVPNVYGNNTCSTGSISCEEICECNPFDNEIDCSENCVFTEDKNIIGDLKIYNNGTLEFDNAIFHFTSPSHTLWISDACTLASINGGSWHG